MGSGSGKTNRTTFYASMPLNSCHRTNINQELLDSKSRTLLFTHFLVGVGIPVNAVLSHLPVLSYAERLLIEFLVRAYAIVYTIGAS